MVLTDKKIGFGLTGSHCTYDQVFPVIDKLVADGADVYPVVSYTVQNVDSRFGTAAEHLQVLEDKTGHTPVSSIVEAEKFGPANPLDAMVVAPLTGNSLSKLANAITDSPVLMATKATMRNQAPVILAISTNDALGLNGVNIMRLMATKGIYFVPFGQDNPFNKPNSLIAKMDYLQDTIEAALENKQFQPVITTY
ncbi:dipicolinate synthase subunit B [Amphibacillus jilinensis]|uniref:dipicolinate synthase subunit B n=1 Tax=Amphibacillus jilinensis TaxID=1216008 RepID=UPI000474792C|nr:dipicolinate synthase subunit B [Amphibacillus jilinensis]